MADELRQAVYDQELAVEACRFVGLRQAFPRHFHDYYVLGLMEAGRRRLCCGERQLEVCPGMVLLFNPGVAHGCQPADETPLAYRTLHIEAGVMGELCAELGGGGALPVFEPCAVADPEAACLLRETHTRIMEGGGLLEREEGLLLLLELLVDRYAGLAAPQALDCRQEVAAAAAYMREHFAEPISLEGLCRQVGLSKSTLLRGFAAAMGITPHSFLANVRVSRAKVLLQQGLPPVEAALQTGFADQSHFTNCFGRFIGLTPGAYREMFGGGLK